MGARIVPLADRLDLVEAVARWHWERWGHADAEGSRDSWTARLEGWANRDAIPTVLVALVDEAPVGSVSLVAHDMPDRRDVWGLWPWLSGLFVVPGRRGRGVGTALVAACEAQARALGVPRLYLYTSTVREFYERLGWAVIREETYAGEVVTLMVKRLLDRTAGEDSPTARPPVEIRGTRVVLRPAGEADVDALVDLLNTPGVVEWWPGQTREHVAAKVAGEDDAVPFVIERDGAVVGFIQYWEEDDPDYRHAGIDIAVATGHQGRGLGPDAVRTMARHLFEDRGHHRVVIDPAAHNERAIRAYEKVGFKPVGIMRRSERGADGTWHDGLLMDLLPEDLTP